MMMCESLTNFAAHADKEFEEQGGRGQSVVIIRFNIMCAATTKDV